MAFASDRRTFMKATAALGGVAALQGVCAVLGRTPAMAAGMELQTLRSTSKSWLWAAEDYAMQQGLFEGAGLKVSMAATERGVNHDALLSGASDILLGSPIQNMRVQLLGRPVKVFCGIVNKYASNVVVKKDIADAAGVTEASPVEDKAKVLKGLRMATTGPGGGPDQLLRYLGRKVGLDPDAEMLLTPVKGGGQAMLAALDGGQVDGFCLSSPTSDLAVSKFGGAYLFNMATNPPPELSNYLYICASATEETLEAKGDQLTAYCKGIAMAQKVIKETPDVFKAWATSWFDNMDPDLFEVSYANNIDIYMPTPLPSAEQFEISKVFLDDFLQSRDKEKVPEDYSFDKAFDLRAAKAALAQL